MRPDNTAPIIAAAKNRHELTRAKAVRALRELDHCGASVTFDTVARAAGVSRSWLYAETDVRAEIERLRDATRQAPSPPIPSRQRASDGIPAHAPAGRDRAEPDPDPREPAPAPAAVPSTRGATNPGPQCRRAAVPTWPPTSLPDNDRPIMSVDQQPPDAA